MDFFVICGVIFIIEKSRCTICSTFVMNTKACSALKKGTNYRIIFSELFIESRNTFCPESACIR